MPASTVVFTYDPGGSSQAAVTMNGPTPPTMVDQVPQFVSDRSADGTRYAYQVHNTVINEWELRLSQVTTPQKTAFDAWFLDTVKGPTNTFSYQHTDGTTYTSCRFVDTALRWSRLSDLTWDLTVRIEVPEEVDS